MAISVKIVREAGQLTMLVDAKGLHDTLDAIGASHNGLTYTNMPQSDYRVCGNGKISPQALLHREYPKRFNLSSIYSAPPSYASLVSITESVEGAVRKVLEHYQPIDISVEIHKKVLVAG